MVLFIKSNLLLRSNFFNNWPERKKEFEPPSSNYVIQFRSKKKCTRHHAQIIYINELFNQGLDG